LHHTLNKDVMRPYGIKDRNSKAVAAKDKRRTETRKAVLRHPKRVARAEGKRLAQNSYLLK